MCRIAWKAWRSCSPASCSTCADSLASHADAGWTCSPLDSSSFVTGCWASQSICRSGWRARSSAAMATSRRAWPSPIGDERYSARGRRHAARVQVCRLATGCTVATNCSIASFTRIGSRPCGPCPPPAMVSNEPPVRSARAAPRAWDWISSPSPWMTSTGQRTRAHVSANGFLRRSSAPREVSAITAGSVSSAHATKSSRGFVECGSLNMRAAKNSTNCSKCCNQNGALYISQSTGSAIASSNE